MGSVAVLHEKTGGMPKAFGGQFTLYALKPNSAQWHYRLARANEKELA
jgi:hypothetical protein